MVKVERDKMVKLCCLKVENRTRNNDNIENSHNRSGQRGEHLCIRIYFSYSLNPSSIHLAILLFLSHFTFSFLFFPFLFSLFFGLACILSSDSHLVWLLLVENFSFHVSHYSTSLGICSYFVLLFLMLISRTGI